MIKIGDIIGSIINDKIRITNHADEEAADDNLTFEEIISSAKKGRIIEQYPDDKPYPSCLVLGRNRKDEPIHTVWAYNTDTSASVLITVYRPDAARWTEDFKTRRKR